MDEAMLPSDDSGRLVTSVHPFTETASDRSPWIRVVLDASATGARQPAVLSKPRMLAISAAIADVLVSITSLSAPLLLQPVAATRVAAIARAANLPPTPAARRAFTVRQTIVRIIRSSSYAPD